MRRKRAPGAGNARELKVMDLLATEGWLCASRRHIGGAGDILAVRSFLSDSPLEAVLRPYMNGAGMTKAMLIEVKSTTRSPWVNFLPSDRQAMVETAERHGCEAWLYWWPPRRDLQRIPASEWPPIRQFQPQVEIEFPTLDEARAEHARAVIERQDDRT
jgi:hypothetical protein